jgi:hypothetical protein
MGTVDAVDIKFSLIEALERAFQQEGLTVWSARRKEEREKQKKEESR